MPVRRTHLRRLPTGESVVVRRYHYRNHASYGSYGNLQAEVDLNDLGTIDWSIGNEGVRRVATIHNVYVDDSVRGLGVGEELVRGAEAELRKRHVRTVYLQDVVPDAWGFWEKMGYHRAKTYPKGNLVGDIWEKGLP